ncbi:protein SOB FIVE-LIKE 5-like [Nicotiana tabacum]|uniref:Protein SOB FIVE-LIKE 5-like n=2 Tax=Nicotiana TaxID=4085 RepID=A0A1S4A1C3_TOBAC|nr:PREDICTED: uncharacterized protein LOC104243975 [Nicotiana sylvestris]XP_016470366.1 PREDICTED: uncharacterized protein LOC107792647 [Nicotiana tabacum]
MNISASECSSGCESGWTMYLDQLSNSEDQYNRRNIDYGIYSKSKTEHVDEYQEDEDMSMVSDASSGPPHFREDYCFEQNGYIFYPSASENTKETKEKRKMKEQKVKKQNLYLDDTASSPFSSFPTDNREYNDRTSMEMVADFSETHSKGKSVLGKHFGFLKTSVSGRTSSEKSSGLKGRKRQ